MSSLFSSKGAWPFSFFLSFFNRLLFWDNCRFFSFYRLCFCVKSKNFLSGVLFKGLLVSLSFFIVLSVFNFIDLLLLFSFLLFPFWHKGAQFIAQKLFFNEDKIQKESLLTSTSWFLSIKETMTLIVVSKCILVISRYDSDIFLLSLYNN